MCGSRTGARAAPERPLDRLELAVAREAFDRVDPGSVRLHRQRQAGERKPAVEPDGATAAAALLAADVDAGQAQLVPEEVAQQQPWLREAGAGATVDGRGHQTRLRHSQPPARSRGERAPPRRVVVGTVPSTSSTGSRSLAARLATSPRAPLVERTLRVERALRSAAESEEHDSSGQGARSPGEREVAVAARQLGEAEAPSSWRGRTTVVSSSPDRSAVVVGPATNGARGDCPLAVVAGHDHLAVEREQDHGRPPAPGRTGLRLRRAVAPPRRLRARRGDRAPLSRSNRALRTRRRTGARARRGACARPGGARGRRGRPGHQRPRPRRGRPRGRCLPTTRRGGARSPRDRAGGCECLSRVW